MSLAQAQAKFEFDAAHKAGGGAEPAAEAYSGVAAPWATQADTWASGYSQVAQAERRPFRKAEYNPPWAHTPALNRPQKSRDHPWASSGVDRGRPDNQGVEGTATYIDGGGAEAGNNGIILTSHADNVNRSQRFPKEAERKHLFLHRRMLDPENPPPELDPRHRVVAPWQQDVGEGKVQGEVDDDEKLATSLVSWSDCYEKPASGFKKGTTGIRNTGATGNPRHQGTRSTYAGGSARGGTAPLNRRRMKVDEEMKTLDSEVRQPKSVKPWESNISDDSEDEEGAPRSTVDLVSWADKRNLVSKRGQKDPKLNEASCYGENVVRNLNRRYLDPDDLKKKKQERKERDMAQAWGASLGAPRAKPIGKPSYETVPPWELNASDGEDNSDDEVEPVTLVSSHNGLERERPRNGAIGLPKHRGHRLTYAAEPGAAGTEALNRRRQKPEDRKKVLQEQRQLGIEHAWSEAHRARVKPADRAQNRDIGDRHAWSVPHGVVKVRPPWESTVSDDSEDEEGQPRAPVTLVSWADKRNYKSRKGQNDPLLMESSCYGERVLRNLNRRFADPEDHKQYKAQRHDRDVAQAWGASVGKPAAAPVRMVPTGRADQTTSPWEKEVSDEEEDPVTGEPMLPVAIVSNADTRERYNPRLGKNEPTLNVRRRTEEMKAARDRVYLDQAWAASIGDARRGNPRYEKGSAGYEWYEAEEDMLRSKHPKPRRVPFRSDERLHCRQVWTQQAEETKADWAQAHGGGSGSGSRGSGSRAGSRRPAESRGGSQRPESRGSQRSWVRTGQSSSARSAVQGDSGSVRYRQFKGVAWAPTDAPPPDAKLNKELPAEELELEWVHGYMGHGRRHNLKFTSSGELVYFAASICIVYDPQSNTQRYFTAAPAPKGESDPIGHDGIITALAIAPDGRTIASGQTCTIENRSPPVCIWDSSTMVQKARLNVNALNEIAALAFSPDGSVLLSVSKDENFTITLTEWASGAKLAVARGGGNPVYGMAFNNTARVPPADKSLRTHAIEIVQIGEKHVKFYRHQGSSLEPDAPEDYKPVTTTTGVAFMHDGSIVVGQGNGDLAQFVYREDEDSHEPAEIPSYVSARSAHDEKAVSVVLPTADGKGLITGGEDGRVLWWAQPDGMPKTAKIDTLELKTEVNLSKVLGVKEQDGAAAGVYAIALSLSVLSGVVAVGTNTNVVLLLDRSQDNRVSHRIVTQGHSGRVAGLVADPTHHCIVSCAGGDDKTCRLWCLRRHAQIASFPLSSSGSAVGISEDGTTVAVGLHNGKLDVIDLDSDSMQPAPSMTAKPCRRKPINAVTFSPDGEFCAVGGRDRVVDVRDTRTWRSVGCSKPPLPSAPLSIDWNSDGEWMQVSTGGGSNELHVVSTGGSVRRNASEQMRDEWHLWKQWSSPFGWPVVGIWPKYANSSSIKAVARSHSQQQLVVGSDAGTVTLFRYPCCTPGAKGRVSYGHGSHVSAAVWSADDQYVVTAGGTDQAILVWKVRSPG